MAGEYAQGHGLLLFSGSLSFTPNHCISQFRCSLQRDATPTNIQGSKRARAWYHQRKDAAFAEACIS